MYLLTPEKNYVIELMAGCTIPADCSVYRLLNSMEERDTLVYEKDARYVVVGALKEVTEE